jgi:hypothetical protein
VNVYAYTLDGQQFTGWTGFTAILDDPNAPATIATIPSNGIDVWIRAVAEVEFYRNDHGAYVGIETQ